MEELVTKNLTCIVCPMGCQLEVKLDKDGKVRDISGNSCKRGYNYANTEFTNPTRTLTSTVKLVGSKVDKFLPVRTAAPIPKPKLFEAMKLIDSLEVKVPVKRGDVVSADFIEQGVDLVACKTVVE